MRHATHVSHAVHCGCHMIMTRRSAAQGMQHTSHGLCGMKHRIQATAEPRLGYMQHT